MNASQPNIFAFTLPEGQIVHLRQIVPEDKERIREGLSRLSPISRYQRFHYTIDHLSEKQLLYLANPDQINHVAWGAFDPTDPGFRGLGVGRYIRLDNPHDAAEVAITVVDDFQHKGLGKLLLGTLYLMAESNGIKSLRGTILPDNRASLHLFKRYGAELTLQNNLFQFVVNVHNDWSRLPSSPSGDEVQSMLHQLSELLKLGVTD